MRIIGNGGHAKVVRELLNDIGLNIADVYAVIAVGDNASRKTEAEKLDDCYFPHLIHPSAKVSKSATVDNGTVIMAGAIVQAGARIGKHCIINTGASVDHDCVIGDYVHIAPGAHLCGHVEVGEGALVGAGVCVAPMGKIPAWTLAKMRRLELVPLFDNA